ncbi:MAG: hypothetical protein RBT60_08985 [Candidatus Krumholzibacteria bacterium]|jgi:spermidine synthase|nr:hypothetical protein [Candidatus Krumholzibacteria bacterium]
MPLLCVGFATMLGLVILLRELGVACFGNEIVYVLGLAVWLLAAAFGAAGSRWQRMSIPVATLSYAAILPASVCLARALRLLPAVAPSGELGLGAITAGAILVMAPAGALSGLLQHVADSQRALPPGGVDRDQVSLCVGSACGGLAAGLLPALGVPALAGALLAGAVASGALAAGGRRRRGLGLAVAFALLAGAVSSGGWDRAMTRWNHPGLLQTRELSGGRLTIADTENGLAVYRDDALLHVEQRSQGHGPGSLALVHLAATQCEQPPRVLLLGGWLEALRPALAAYAAGQVVNVEPDRELIDLAAPYTALPPPRDEVVHADPIAWLLGTNDRFDLILSVLAEPLTAGANRVWSLDFYGLCARRLHDGGVLAVRLRTGDAVWTLRQARRIAAIHRALDQVFAHVQVLPGPITVLLASQRPLQREPEVLAARWREVGAAPSEEVNADWLRLRWQGHRTGEATSLLAAAAVPANTDLRPVAFADNLIWDLGVLIPGLGWREVPLPSRWLMPIVAGGVLVVIWLRRRRHAAAILAAGYAGLAASILTSVLLLYHQSLHGLLYRDLGFVLALVKLAEAGGCKLAAAWPGRVWRKNPASRWPLPALLVVISLWSFLVTVGLLLGSNVITCGIWLAGIGLLTGMVADAIVRGGTIGTRRRQIALLGGGGLGVLPAAVLLIPFGGLAAAALTVTALAFPAAVAVWPLPGSPPRGLAGC